MWQNRTACVQIIARVRCACNWLSDAIWFRAPLVGLRTSSFNGAVMLGEANPLGWRDSSRSAAQNDSPRGLLRALCAIAMTVDNSVLEPRLVVFDPKGEVC